jgi:hypothetical protein
MSAVGTPGTAIETKPPPSTILRCIPVWILVGATARRIGDLSILNNTKAPSPE